MNYTTGKNIAMGALALMILRVAGFAFFLFLGSAFSSRFYDISLFFSRPILICGLELILAAGFAFMFLDGKNPLDLMVCLSLIVAVIFDFFWNKIMGINHSAFIRICLNILTNAWIGVIALRAFAQGNQKFFVFNAVSLLYMSFGFIMGDLFFSKFYGIGIIGPFARMILPGLNCIALAVPLLYLYAGDGNR